VVGTEHDIFVAFGANGIECAHSHHLLAAMVSAHPVSSGPPPSMRLMVHAAYLRVYTRQRADDDLPAYTAPVKAGIVTEGDFGLWEESIREDALQLEFDGKTFVCPRRPRLRMLEGLLAFHHSFPGMTGSMLVPEDIVRRAAAELEAIYENQPSARSHILTSAWHVPLRWFAAFRPDQREIVTTEAGTSIRYRATRSDVSDRLERTVEILQTAGFDESIVAPVEGLVSWLSEFAKDSVVELDYGTVAQLFDDGDLVLDETAADVTSSIEALAAGDLDRASDHYALAAGRWAEAQARVYSN